MIAHVFVDAENISPSVTFKVVEHFGKEHTITKVDIVAKEETLPARYRNLDEKLYRVQNCFYGKNSADTWLCMEVVRAIIDEPDLELIILVSSDKDFLPVIKFAVDFEKKVFVVSSGEGHRTLAEQLKILNVDSAAVELKDFRLKFGDVPRRLEKFLPLMSFNTKKYFFDREDRIKFILVKRGEQLFEVPFISGMNALTFRRLLRELNIIGWSTSLQIFVDENFLKLSRDRVYFRTEAEISEPTSAELVANYLAAHAAELRTILIKHNERLTEIPFADGMPLDVFGKMLRERKIIGKTASILQTAERSLLKVFDGKVYLRSEEEQELAFESTIKNVDEYLSFHAAELKRILIKHNGKTCEVPFVNGITLELFGKLLREQNIIGKSVSATSVARKNFLDVRDGRIYLCGEERLSELYAEATGDLAGYFYQNEAKTIKIFVKHDGKLFEISFINGMPLSLFELLLRNANIIGKKASAVKVAANSLLAIRDERVWLMDEDELATAQDDLETNVDAYLNAHALDIRTTKILRGGQVHSIPFVAGMPLKVFGKLLRERHIIDRTVSAEKVAVSNGLTVRDEKVFKGAAS